MSIYIRLLSGVIDKYPAYPEIENPNVSFPHEWTGGKVGKFNYAVVNLIDKPEFDSNTQILVEDTPESIGGIWRQKWGIQNLTNIQLEEKLNKEREQMAISPFQAHEALAQFGWLEIVENYMANPETSPTIVRAWNKASEFRRLSPTVLLVKSILNITDQQLDDWFRLAKTITA